MSSPDKKRMKLADKAQNETIKTQICSTAKDILEPVLSPERCHQLREGGILELMVQLLHEHTFEPNNRPEADFNIESFIKRFNRKSLQRKRLAQRIRTIVENTAKDDSELEILRLLEAMRALVEKLCLSITNESSQQIIPPEMLDLIKFITDDNTRPIFELFGGVFVILDHFRAQVRFYAKWPKHWLEGSLILAAIIATRPYFTTPFHLRIDLKRLLLNGGEFYTTLAEAIKKVHCSHEIVSLCCETLHMLQETLHQDREYIGVHYPRRVFNQQYIRDYELTKCLAELTTTQKDPETLCHVLKAIRGNGISEADHDNRSVLAFCSVDGAIGAVIDVLVPSEEKDNDVENAKWYEKQRLHSSAILYNINLFLLGDEIDPLLAREQWLAKEQLLNIYEKRNIVETLVHYLKLANPDDDSEEDLELPFTVIIILASVLKCSDNQRRKFLQIDGAIETIERFEESCYSATEILELFEE